MPGTIERIDTLPSLEVELTARMYDCDSLPWLAEQRRDFFYEGADILNQNTVLLNKGAEDEVPLAIDVLGTARTLSRISQDFGEESVEYSIGDQGLELDSARLAAEVWRKNRWEYFEPVFHHRDPVSGKYFVNGFDTRSVVVNGLSPLAEEGEQTVRLFDYVEQRTKEAIGASDLASEGISMVTIKPCPKYVRDAYEQDPNKGHGGYAPSVDKLFIQSENFTKDGCLQEELALPGTYITTEIINEVLAEAEAIVEGASLTREEIRAKQFLSISGDPILELAAKLDKKASEQSGLNIFMGEVVGSDHPKDYAAAKQEAIDRQEAQKPFALEIKEELKNYQDNEVDSRVASCKLDSHLKKRLFELAYKDPELAQDIFDKKTADGLKEAKELERLGADIAGYVDRLFKEAPAPSYCGAGSCGLEAASNPIHIARVKELGLTGELVHDAQRACPKCQQMSVYYSLEDGSKACGNCFAYEKGKN